MYSERYQCYFSCHNSFSQRYNLTREGQRLANKYGVVCQKDGSVDPRDWWRLQRKILKSSRSVKPEQRQTLLLLSFRPSSFPSHHPPPPPSPPPLPPMPLLLPSPLPILLLPHLSFSSPSPPSLLPIPLLLPSPPFLPSPPPPPPPPSSLLLHLFLRLFLLSTAMRRLASCSGLGMEEGEADCFFLGEHTRRLVTCSKTVEGFKLPSV